MFRFSDIGLESDLILLVALGLIIILFIMMIVLLAKNSNLKKRYENFMSGEDGRSLEKAFQKKFQNVEFINDKLNEMDEHLKKIDDNLLKTYQKVGIVKYDAFKQIGGSLSFVVALLTMDHDGFILNCMHSNTEGCYTYIKEVKKGEVFVTLSDEELQALEEAKNCHL